MDMHFEGVIFHSHADELGRRLAHAFPPFAVLDVRPREDHASSRIPGAIHCGPGKLELLPAGTDEATEFFVVGADPADQAIRKAARKLQALGARRVVEVTGGYYEWRRRGLPEEAGKASE